MCHSIRNVCVLSALPPKLDTFMFQQINIQLMYVTLVSRCEQVSACAQLLEATFQSPVWLSMSRAAHVCNCGMRVLTMILKVGNQCKDGSCPFLKRHHPYEWYVLQPVDSMIWLRMRM